MNLSAALVPQKWRPSVGLVVALVITAALCLPLAGLFFFRIYENQLVRQTEAELIGQSAVLSAVMAREIEAATPSDTPLGPEITPSGRSGGLYQPIAPTLDLTARDLLGRRPEAAPAPAIDPIFLALGARLAPDLAETQRLTLAGFRLLDPHGVVIAGRDEVGQSLAHIEEVASALQGRFRSAIRLRVSKHEPPPLYSWSRGTGIRVFTAMPVIARGRVAGVVYASRTPSNVFKSFYDEGIKVAAAVLAIAAMALWIGFIFQRTITRPMRALMARALALGRGEREALAPIAHYGTAEFAQLSQSFFKMAEALQNRSDFLTTFAAHVSHELKSPLTAIQGAVELLRDEQECCEPGMSLRDRRRFLDNIATDLERMTAIVKRLRELARAETAPTTGQTHLRSVIAELASGFDLLRVEGAGDLDAAIAMSMENALIVLSHLADNARAHGAKSLTISCLREGDELKATVRDDGAGVSRANRAKIFDHFFTTRRESGGTGMGLAIARAMMQAHGGDIELLDEDAYSSVDGRPSGGAVFALTFAISQKQPLKI